VGERKGGGIGGDEPLPFFFLSCRLLTEREKGSFRRTTEIFYYAEGEGRRKAPADAECAPGKRGGRGRKKVASPSL